MPGEYLSNRRLGCTREPARDTDGSWPVSLTVFGQSRCHWFEHRTFCDIRQFLRAELSRTLERRYGCRSSSRDTGHTHRAYLNNITHCDRWCDCHPYRETVFAEKF